eukprot:COSAG05_NODE_10008_length_588_cov_1.087935_2_plen_43_part_01
MGFADDDSKSFSMMVAPPPADALTGVQFSKHIIFLIYRSGSMT